jgi:hypothetical protein
MSDLEIDLGGGNEKQRSGDAVDADRCSTQLKRQRTPIRNPGGNRQIRSENRGYRTATENRPATGLRVSVPGKVKNSGGVTRRADYATGTNYRFLAQRAYRTYNEAKQYAFSLSSYPRNCEAEVLLFVW